MGRLKSNLMPMQMQSVLAIFDSILESITNGLSKKLVHTIACVASCACSRMSKKQPLGKSICL